jgi:hypothetical protein
MRPTLRNNSTFVLLLNKRKNLREIRLGQLVWVFLHKDGFNGVLVRDNYKALSTKKRKKEKEKRRERDVACEAMRGCVTFGFSASRTEVASKTRPSPTTKSAWWPAIKRTAFRFEIISPLKYEGEWMDLTRSSGANSSFLALSRRNQLLAKTEGKEKIKNARGEKEYEEKHENESLFFLQCETSCARAHRHEQRTHFVKNTSSTVMM